ncbi:DUF6509 family protein [Planococcus sp. ISL-109]|uniref:DUF6509 family protein n=1 Tax=Planococcus sp. ISL-109 TaxID=2819166 RepID=UPI001BEB91DE|nr:DUF6509 family protein [Planococcus sp. ISL-109]MBT2581479.1 pullulanase [Planococcus sp. ISL-109]
MEIINHEVRKMNDPTGILEGDRYEYTMSIEVEEDDELYRPGGLELRLILVVNEGSARIASYHFNDKETEQPLDFALDEEEEEQILAFCKERTEA